MGILPTFKDLPNALGWPRVLPDVLETTGKGDAFAIMPPYVALYYCKKD